LLAQLGALSWVGVTNSLQGGQITQISHRGGVDPNYLLQLSPKLAASPLVALSTNSLQTNPAFYGRPSCFRPLAFINFIMRFSIVAAIATFSATVVGQGNLANIPTCAVCTALSSDELVIEL
jgi:hypothetical protein